MNNNTSGIKRQYHILMDAISRCENMDQVRGYRKAVEVFNMTHNNPLIMTNLENLLIIKSIEYNGDVKEETQNRFVNSVLNN